MASWVDATQSLVVLAYVTVFQNFETGTGVAVAFLMTIVLVVISVVLYRQIRKVQILEESRDLGERLSLGEEYVEGRSGELQPQPHPGRSLDLAEEQHDGRRGDRLGAGIMIIFVGSTISVAIWMMAAYYDLTFPVGLAGR